MRRLILPLITSLALLNCSQRAQSPEPAVVQNLAIGDLPVHVVDNGRPAKTFAVFLTGDGGWASFDQHVCTDLASRGVPTIGFDTGGYFSQMRDPYSAAQALARTLRVGFARWHADRAIVVGYSFGADIAPFLVNRLPADLHDRIDRVALMGPSPMAPFQVTPAERVGLSSPGARPVAPEIAGASQNGVRIVCLYGAHDRDAICPDLHDAWLKTARLSGGHGFRGDADGVAKTIVGAWPVSV